MINPHPYNIQCITTILNAACFTTLQAFFVVDTVKSSCRFYYNMRQYVSFKTIRRIPSALVGIWLRMVQCFRMPWYLLLISIIRLQTTYTQQSAAMHSFLLFQFLFWFQIWTLNFFVTLLQMSWYKKLKKTLMKCST